MPPQTCGGTEDTDGFCLSCTIAKHGLPRNNAKCIRCGGNTYGQPGCPDCGAVQPQRSPPLTAIALA
ncbi:hypothetical protein H4R18_002336, partial [Coemansia javaensis]